MRFIYIISKQLANAQHTLNQPSTFVASPMKHNIIFKAHNNNFEPSLPQSHHTSKCHHVSTKKSEEMLTQLYNYSDSFTRKSAIYLINVFNSIKSHMFFITNRVSHNYPPL